jgi:hypothetical protein
MNIIQLIDHLKTRSLAEKLIKNVVPGVEYDEVVIYMREQVGLEAEISFFDAEAISNHIMMEVEGQMYECFFGIWEAQEMVEEMEAAHSGNLGNLAIAERMLHYHKFDA